MATLIFQANIVNDFHGWKGDTVFQFSNGQIWQQSVYRYQYMYAYRPLVKVVQENGQYLLVYNGCELPIKRLK